MEKFSLEWEAPEYEYHEKGVSWYWTSIIIAALIIAFAVWQRNFLFGVFVVIAEILFIVWGNRPPEIINFRINENEIEVGGSKKHSFNEFGTMSVDFFGDGSVDLIFAFQGRFKTPLKIIFPEARVADLRAFLKASHPSIKEIPYEPTLTDTIEKLLRF